MKAGLLRRCPGRMAIPKREHVVTGLRIAMLGGRVNVMGALMGMTFLTVALFDGRVNSDVFYAWLIQELLPKTPAGTVIVMDNASFHKRHDMLEAISANQCKVEFLPPYSPDLNPIEHKWAQAKAVRRRYWCGIDELFSEHSQYVVL